MQHNRSLKNLNSPLYPRTYMNFSGKKGLPPPQALNLTQTNHSFLNSHLSKNKSTQSQTNFFTQISYRVKKNPL